MKFNEEFINSTQRDLTPIDPCEHPGALIRTLSSRGGELWLIWSPNLMLDH